MHIAKCIGEPRRLAPCVLNPAFRALGLDEPFAILKAFGIEFRQQLYTRGEIRSMKASVNPFQDVVTKLL